MPEIPATRKARFVNDLGLSEYDADILSSDAAQSAFFEQAAKVSGDAKLSANWVMGDVNACLNNDEITIKDAPINADLLGGLILRIKDNTISNKIAKQVFEAMWAGEGDADTVIEAKGLKQVSDTGALEAMVDDVLNANAAMVEEYINTEEAKRKKKLGGFMGPIMKASKGQANPKVVNEILLKKLNQRL